MPAGGRPPTPERFSP